MKRYTVNCHWDPTGWWAVDVAEVPGAITQSRRLDQVQRDVAEVLSLMTGEKAKDYTLDIRPVVSNRPGRDAGRARKLRDR